MGVEIINKILGSPEYRREHEKPRNWDRVFKEWQRFMLDMGKRKSTIRSSTIYREKD